jgi:drug/metabolite transporter (DMT)-like permease
MSSLATCFWIGSVLLDTAGRLAFKSAAMTEGVAGEWQRWKGMLRSPALWAGILCFSLEFVVWLALLSLIPLSQAILIGSINIVVVALAGRVFFRERLDATRIAGFVLIAIGVALAGGFA